MNLARAPSERRAEPFEVHENRRQAHFVSEVNGPLGHRPTRRPRLALPPDQRTEEPRHVEAPTMRGHDAVELVQQIDPTLHVHGGSIGRIEHESNTNHATPGRHGKPPPGRAPPKPPHRPDAEPIAPPRAEIRPGTSDVAGADRVEVDQAARSVPAVSRARA